MNIKCYKCGGLARLISSKPLYSGKVHKNEYACLFCGERIRQKERISDEEWRRTKAERREKAKEEEKYCSGDNCLTCKYTVCMEDRRDHTSAERRTG